MELIDRTLTTNTPQVGECSVPVEGLARVFELRMAPAGTDDVLVIMRDITERGAAETRMSARQARSASW